MGDSLLSKATSEPERSGRNLLARETAPHSTPLADQLRSLAVDPARGLSSSDVDVRIARHGLNELRAANPVRPSAIFVAQFRSIVVLILIGAAVVSAALGDIIDAAAILAIVILNAIFGFYQEYRASLAAAALAHLVAPKARVVRDGASKVVPAIEVVPGDILLLESGDLVAADARLIDAQRLHINEAPLTGESQPVRKAVGELPGETLLADRANMVFLGTSVSMGTARAAVVSTGMNTEVGHIAGMLGAAGADETPLQRRLDLVGRKLLWASIGIVAVIFLLGLIRSIPPFELFLSAVSLAVAAIPEGLPAVVTVALALGMQRMARRNALIKHLPAVETLGCAQVICTDKTGTLTVGEMTVRKVVTYGAAYAVSGEGYAPAGAYLSEGTKFPETDHVLRALLLAGAACNDAELTTRAGHPGIVGDPTEGAILVAAAKVGIQRGHIEAESPRIGGVPFDSDRKRMTVLRRCGSNVVGYVKGAPEVILGRCTHVLSERGVEPITDADRTRLAQAGAAMANDALRVLAIAQRSFEASEPSQVAGLSAEAMESDLVFLGMVGLQDPPRAEAREAVSKCRGAGIRIVMITGDHPDTARAIARELGILERPDQVMSGAELAAIDDRGLATRVTDTAVYARVTAADKLRIVRAWRSRGVVVAMTGDGVNDAPALKEASIGVAMGITGTEVTKQSADMIITDDNFASIVAAVEEGRGIYDNIAKTLGYLLTGNAAELLVMLVAAVVGWPLPLLPIHLLWINLVTDGLPALALATDPVDKNVLAKPPRPQQAQLIDRGFLATIAITSAVTATVTLVAFALEYEASGSLADARDAAFTVLVFSELLRSFGARSSAPIWETGIFGNMRLFGVVLISFSLQLAIHHVPALQSVFGIEPIGLEQCLAWIALGLVPLAVGEIRKVAGRPTRTSAQAAIGGTR
jgi:Ca2+-transporting ATPase